MADLSSVIELIFRGVDDVSEVASKVSASLSSMGSTVTNIAQPFASAAKGIEIFSAALATAGTAMGVIAFNSAIKFESSLADLNKQLEAGEGQASDYANTLNDLALKYGVNANAVAASLTNFKAAGFSASESLTLVKTSLDYVIASGLDAGFASEKMIAILKGFDAPATQAGHAMDVLNKAADMTASSSRELTQGMADLSPIAKLAGLSFEDTAAILSKIVDVFGSGSEAADALKTGLLRLVDPSAEAAAELSRLEVATKDSSGNLRNVKDILLDLGPAFVKLTDSQQLQSASIIFGKEQAAKMVQVMGQMNEAMDLSAKLTATAGGSMEKEVVERLKTGEVAVNRFVEAWRQLNTAIGTQFKEGGKDALNALTDLEHSFAKLIEGGGLAPLFDAMRPAIESFVKTVESIANNLPAAFRGVDFSPLIISAGDLGREFLKLFDLFSGGVDLTTVEGLQIVIQKIINGSAALIDVVNGIARAFEPFVNAAGRASDSFSELDRASHIDFGTFLGTMQAVVAAGPALSAVLYGIAESGLSMFDAMNVAFGGLKVIINSLQLGFNVIELGALQFARAMEIASFAITWGDVAKQHEKNVGEITDLIEKAKTAALRNSDELWQGWDQATGKTGTATDSLRAKMDTFKKSQEGLSAAEKDVISGFDDSINAVSRYENAMEDAEKANRKAGDSAKGLQAANKDVFALSANVAANEYVDSLGNIVKSYDQVGAATVKATGAFKLHGEAAKRVGEETDAAAKKTDEFKIKMEQIASNERIKTIEFAVKLNIASIEGETKRVEAAFKSIDNTVTDTGKLISDLFGDLAKATSYDKVDIQNQIEKENRRRDQALADQHDLVQAQVELLRARLERINTGEALIRIDSAGTEPALEALLWELLKKIQIRANSEMQDFLLGVKLAA
jgi:TP901 family phage tail tape measure protein